MGRLPRVIKSREHQAADVLKVDQTLTGNTLRSRKRPDQSANREYTRGPDLRE